MKYLALAAALTLTNCTTQQTVQPVVVEIESPQYKEPLLIIPEPVYKKPKKKEASLDNLVKNFVEESIKSGVESLEYGDFAGYYLRFERDDTHFEFYTVINRDTLQLYGNNNIEDIKATYTTNTTVGTTNGSFILISIPENIDLNGPLKEPLTDMMRVISSETKKHRLMELVSSGELSIYTDKINSPKFHQACAAISEYVLANK